MRYSMALPIATPQHNMIEYDRAGSNGMCWSYRSNVELTNSNNPFGDVIPSVKSTINDTLIATAAFT
jgi:hypothetical protein